MTVYDRDGGTGGGVWKSRKEYKSMKRFYLHFYVHRPRCGGEGNQINQSAAHDELDLESVDTDFRIYLKCSVMNCLEHPEMSIYGLALRTTIFIIDTLPLSLIQRECKFDA